MKTGRRISLVEYFSQEMVYGGPPRPWTVSAPERRPGLPYQVNATHEYGTDCTVPGYEPGAGYYPLHFKHWFA